MNALERSAVATFVHGLDELERSILEAHASGDQVRLQELQAEYRTRDVVRVNPPPTIPERGRSAAPASSQGTRKRSRLDELREEIRRRPSPTRRIKTVELTSNGRDSIMRFWRTDKGETGGFLFGSLRDKSVCIDFANEAGEGMERGSTYIAYDSDLVEFYQRIYREPVIGCWHLHPGRPNPQPSPEDRKSWRKLAGEFGRDGIWTSIIVGDNGLSYPLRAWLTEFRGGNSCTYEATLIKPEVSG